MTYLTGFGPRTKETPQSEPMPGTSQVQNSAGGYSFAVDDWTRLDRFLILGSEGGSYYATERDLTKENGAAVHRCIAADGLRTVRRVVEISEAGRAPKNDPALFALAMCCAAPDDATRRAALGALPRVARIGTHLFHFLRFLEEQRGWGRSARWAVANWYQSMPLPRLTEQAIKYRQRDGWTHADALRLSHTQTDDPTRNTLYSWIVDGWPDIGSAPHPDPVLARIWAFERIQRETRPAEAMNLILDYQLPRECVPTELLTSSEVWAALLSHMPLEAMIKNLATMTRVGLLAPFSGGTQTVLERLRDGEAIRKARLHPIKILAALLTYSQGRGQRSEHTWTPVQAIIDALNDAFYLSFQTVEPTNRRRLIALDVSGSMEGGSCGGVLGLTPRVGSAAMALLTAATERQWEIVGFSQTLVPIAISPGMRLDTVVQTISRIPMGGTDCSLPMIYALENGLEVDAFEVYTDSETWAGRIHPVQALRAYREKTGIPAKLTVVGMVSNEFSIADPNDGGMLDIVGFDTAAPAIMADFIRG